MWKHALYAFPIVGDHQICPNMSARNNKFTLWWPKRIGDSLCKSNLQELNDDFLWQKHEGFLADGCWWWMMFPGWWTLSKSWSSSSSLEHGLCDFTTSLVVVIQGPQQGNPFGGWGVWEYCVSRPPFGKSWWEFSTWMGWFLVQQPPAPLSN